MIEIFAYFVVFFVGFVAGARVDRDVLYHTFKALPDDALTSKKAILIAINPDEKLK